ncbi:capsid protein [Peromfec virus RodF8_89]|uniref:Capsid protein n=1 Tax=Peromfec virus RodF8_89 TaxID=2929279 RepID=A0A976N285_9VIRU|nr:capsid protein [Peromfec virus RodF8_89]
MAYRSYAKRRPTRRYSTKKKSSSRRRLYVRKRSTYRSRRMSKKVVLNTTSRKKRNGMLSWSNTNGNGASKPVAAGTGFVAGGTIGVFVFCPTAMNLLQGGTNPNYMINTAERTATTCYMRGFAENLRVQTNSHIPWFHRRICFTTKGINPFNNTASSDTPTQPWSPYVDTSNGMERLFFNENINAQPATLAAQYELLFKGAQNQDWDDLITAAIDTTRVDLKFDKTWLLTSQNESGTIKVRKLWHPMNKNIVYADDESGESMASAYGSVGGKQGMGDYYIMDVFQSGLGASSTDLLSVFSNATLYWHEK